MALVLFTKTTTKLLRLSHLNSMAMNSMAMPRPHPFSPLQLILLLSLSLSLIPHSLSISFSYPSFNQTSQGIHYQGQAAFLNDSIHLTSAQSESFGRAVYYQSVPIWDSLTSNVTDFTTSFSFIVDGSHDSDGLAFFLAPYPSVAPTKSDGTYLALFNGSLDTIHPSKIMAVEFDSSGIPPQSNNQIKPDTQINNFSVTTVSLNASVSQGIAALAVVNYKYSTKIFTVSLSFPSGTVGRQNWSISHICDLKETLPSEVAVGFSSSMNNGSQPHRILSWNFTSTLQVKSQPSAERKNTGKLSMYLGVGFAVAILILALLGFVVRWRTKVQKKEKIEQYSMAIDQSIHRAFDRGAGPRRFTYAQLMHATRNFSEDRILGRGGSGEVYRGNLTEPNIQVAVKRISSSERGKKEYISEVTIISRIRHRNLVQLIGFCHENSDLLLVYEFMSNGSLDTHLYNQDHILAWPERYKIFIGLASALLYLHEECEQCVVHRDIKPSNIMLDSDFNPKLGDFGLARLMDHDHGSLTTRLAGTFGYIAPEYGASGKASRETDMFSFGVVTLEILCGRKPLTRTGNEEADLVQWVWDNHGRGAALTVVDQRLQMDFEVSRVDRMIAVGLWCAHPDYTQRPTIRQVMNAINSDGPMPELPSQMPVPMYRPPCFSDKSSSSQNHSSADNYSFSSITNSAVLGR